MIQLLETVSLSLVGSYQRHLSPRKGFNCAYRMLHRDLSCSAYFAQQVQTQGIRRAIPALRSRFQACKAAHLILQANAEEERRKRQRWDWTNCCDGDVACQSPGACYDADHPWHCGEDGCAPLDSCEVGECAVCGGSEVLDVAGCTGCECSFFWAGSPNLERSRFTHILEGDTVCRELRWRLALAPKPKFYKCWDNSMLNVQRKTYTQNCGRWDRVSDWRQCIAPWMPWSWMAVCKCERWPVVKPFILSFNRISITSPVLIVGVQYRSRNAPCMI